MHTARLSRLLKNLNHEDASERRSAAEALSEGDERAVYPLIKALRDDNLGVQDAAMRSLMEIKGESTAYMLLPLLREDAFLRNTALIILREIGKSAVPLLVTLLKDKDDDVRKFALDIIYDIKYCDYPEKIVKLLTDDPNANVRAAAAKVTGALQYREGTPQLINALKDEEWVCFSALEALTDLKDQSAINPITSLLKTDSELIRLAAIETLGVIGSPGAARPLTRHIKKSEGLEKKATIKSLVQIGSIPSIQGISGVLIDMLKNDDWEEKLIAVKGLVMLKEKKSIYHMIDIAGSLDPSDPENEDKLLVFSEAIKSFGCARSIISILNDKTIKYRGKGIAIKIAGDLKCKEAVPALVKLLKSEYRDVRRSSIKSLSQIDSSEAKECLMGAINDHDSHVRKIAVTALGKIGDTAAFDPLVNMLKIEEYNDVIEEFVKSLLNINSTLFLSQINEFDDRIKETVGKYAELRGLEVTC
jgi:HEAT repeat protein